jgi:hypothetical protein
VTADKRQASRDAVLETAKRFIDDHVPTGADSLSAPADWTGAPDESRKPRPENSGGGEPGRPLLPCRPFSRTGKMVLHPRTRQCIVAGCGGQA